MALKVTVDAEMCEGNGICARVAPEIFTVAAVATVNMETVPEALRLKAMLAARQCPAAAIKLIEA